LTAGAYSCYICSAMAKRVARVGGRSNARTSLPHLAPAELDIMKVLWKSGQLSAREIHDSVASSTGWAYSTTRTLVERMVQKGLLVRQDSHGLHIYGPAISRPQGMARLVQEFGEQVLGLASPPVATLFSESEALTKDEIDELRRLLLATGRGRTGRQG
jgi:BlaI family transcriptional regulator, penicillinase repressor